MHLAKTLRARGYSLLEVALALAMLVGVLGALLTFFIALFGRQQRADLQHEAVATLDTVASVFRERVRSRWPASVAVKRSAFGAYDYQVDDLGLLSNPLNTKAALSMKELQVRVFYKVQLKGKWVDREYSTRLWVGK